jgi:hypothetical protein
VTTLKQRGNLRRLAEEAAETAVGLRNLGLSMKRDDHWQISAARVLDAARILAELADRARDAYADGYASGMCATREAGDAQK